VHENALEGAKVRMKEMSAGTWDNMADAFLITADAILDDAVSV
jgi:hypothetical protein